MRAQRDTDDTQDHDIDPLLPQSAKVSSKRANGLAPSVVLSIFVMISISTTTQEALFCVLTWKVGLSVAVAVQGGWVFVSLMVMCFLTISGVPLPVPRGNSRMRIIFTLLVGCGMLFGAITAIAGGYQFAYYAHLHIGHPNIDLAVPADHLSIPGEQRLESLDYMRFAPGFHVLRSSAKRTSLEHHFLCAAPVVGAHETGIAYFYAVSNDNHCCSFDAFPCYGWDGTVANAVVLKEAERASYEDAVDAVALTMAAMQVPKVVVQFTALDPTEGADPYLLRALAMTACGFIAWPLPALTVYYWYESNNPSAR